MSFAELFPNFRKVSGDSSASKTLDGIDPPASTLSKLERMLCPLGRTVARTPRRFSRIISALYGFKTFLLSALGHGVFPSHQTCSTESFTLMRRTVTHSAGIGSFAGLYQ